MRPPFRRACAALMALAILLVSATCTSAGCLLQADSSPVQTSLLAASCCPAHAPAGEQKPGHTGGDGRCPLCHGPVFVGKTAERHAIDLSAAISSPLPTALIVPSLTLD